MKKMILSALTVLATSPAFATVSPAYQEKIESMSCSELRDEVTKQQERVNAGLNAFAEAVDVAQTDAAVATIQDAKTKADAAVSQIVDTFCRK